MMRPQTLRMLGRPARLNSGIKSGLQPTYFTSNGQNSARAVQNRFLSSFRDAFTRSGARGTLSASSSRVSQRRTQAAWQQLREMLSRRSFSARARLNSSKATDAAKDETSLSARMKKLSREYGWSALGVYLLLSAADFPFFYLLVRYMGAERIGEWEHAVTSKLAVVVPPSIQAQYRELRDWIKGKFFKAEEELEGEEAHKEKGNASLATQLALAYAVHKSFIFVRVPLTAAVTPKVVKVLRGWGWDIGKRTSKAQKAANRAELAAKTK